MDLRTKLIQPRILKHQTINWLRNKNVEVPTNKVGFNYFKVSVNLVFFSSARHRRLWFAAFVYFFSFVQFVKWHVSAAVFEVFLNYYWYSFVSGGFEIRMPPAVFMGSLDDRWTWDGADFVAIALWQKYKTNTCTY